jgi:hypothetical protein
MRIKMLTTAAGPDGVYLAGQVVNVYDKLAEAFIAGGYAKKIEEHKQTETATLEAPKKAVMTEPKRRKAK